MVCQRGHFDLGEVFMEHAATLRVINAGDKNGLKSLHYACERVYSAEVKIFMKNAVDLSIVLIVLF